MGLERSEAAGRTFGHDGFDLEGGRFATEELADPHVRGGAVDQIIGIESRGFIFGAALALELGVGFVPIRKPGKLPYDRISAEYELEYGTDKIEIHREKNWLRVD